MLHQTADTSEMSESKLARAVEGYLGSVVVGQIIVHINRACMSNLSTSDIIQALSTKSNLLVVKVTL